MFRYLLIVLCLVTLLGCDQNQPTATTSAQKKLPQLSPLPEVSSEPVSLFGKPVSAFLGESPAEAIPVWRKFAKAKPTLVLLSQNPFLTPVPQELEQQVKQLIFNGQAEDFKNKATSSVANPIMLPQMSVRSALDAGFFSRLIWVLPQADKKTILSLDVFRKQLIDSGIATSSEAQLFIDETPGFSGTLSNTEIRVIPYSGLDKLPTSSVLHIDLSFFRSLYVNEIKTPIHPLIYQLLSKLRTSDATIFGTTISSPHQEGDISLTTRFVGPLLARYLAKPTLLDQPPSPNEQRHRQALYLDNFFKKEEVRKLYLEMEKDAPQDPAVKYALYQVSRQFKQGSKALDYLSQTVSLDSAYALEYLSLSAVALDKKRPDEALRMLELAQKAFPNDPFITLRKAKVLLLSPHKEEGSSLVKELLKQPWSKIYYQQIPGLLKAELNPPI